jgi:hypothetical protein
MKDKLEELKNKLPCIQGGCDLHGTIPEQDGDGDWQPAQCEFCYKFRFPFFEELNKYVAQAIDQAVAEAVKEERDTYKSYLYKEAFRMGSEQPMLPGVRTTIAYAFTDKLIRRTDEALSDTESEST